MTTIGGQTRVAWGRNFTAVCGGTTRGELDNWRLTWNYRMLVAEVSGTYTPTLGTGLFHGELQFGELWSTDEDIATMAKPSVTTNDIPVTTFTGAGTDTQGTPSTKTYTVTGRLNEIELQWKKGDFMMAMGRVHEVVSITDGTTSFP